MTKKFMITVCVSLLIISVGRLFVTNYMPDRSGITTEATLPSSKSAYYSDRVAVLMYHHIVNNPTKGDDISVKQFDEQMRLLKENGFHAIGMDQYRNFMLHGESVPNNAVLITFDDGYESFYEFAYPCLKKYGFPAVNFVIASKISNPTQPGFPKLTWDQMREMKQSGMDFMNHSYNLHSFGKVDVEGKKEEPLTVGRLYLKQEGRPETVDEYKQRVKADLAQAEAILKMELGNTYGAFAFPYGNYNDDLLDMLSELGIELSFTVDSGLNTSNNKKAFRVNAGRSDFTPKSVIDQLDQFKAVQ
ncbi:polysaccharide deacetylase family protein [Paenibacillus sp. N1-5-1-14]|uniref:polysaccharide deacetylase family protein n=1 Tax=Paenibacillus radicibacter TaxID=2972488 RepID=UPI0021590FD7|nr:polysaccharide deacetylase family protein [Paenibacillus radicibacter]MCR8645426.1 polysaccharide deacetylase family protein [Paenibacillus radicibacter]